MAIGLMFWILMLIWLIFGLWTYWPNYGHVGNGILLFILLLLLGWHAFGPPIRA